MGKTIRNNAMQPAKTYVTVAEFDAFVELPENAEKLFEYIGGEIVEVPSNPYASKVSSLFIIEFGIYLRTNDIGHVTGEAGGYKVAGEKYAPDAAFISYTRQPQLAQEGYNPNAPDLAVEVDFPSSYESQRQLNLKIANYLAAGTLLWVVYPESKEVVVYAPGQPARILGINGILDGGAVLPGFKLAVKVIFPE
jgi:Uma2 family endonuclease